MNIDGRKLSREALADIRIKAAGSTGSGSTGSREVRGRVFDL